MRAGMNFLGFTVKVFAVGVFIPAIHFIRKMQEAGHEIHGISQQAVYFTYLTACIGLSSIILLYSLLSYAYSETEAAIR